MRPRSAGTVVAAFALLVPLAPAAQARPTTPSIARLRKPFAHGDPAPKGVTLGTTPSTASLQQTVRRRAGKSGASTPSGAASASTAASSSGTAASAVPGLWTHVQPSCSGSGTDGNRVQVVYAVENGNPNRFAALTSVFLDEIAGVDDVFAVSSKETGGGRRVRWVRDPATCTPSILNLTLPAGSLTNDDFSLMRNALVAQGLTDPSRKYLVLADASRICGFAEVFDDPTTAGNYNNGNAPAMFGRVDAPCWVAGSNGSIPAHELMHTLGGVQPSSPHHNAANVFHCTDDADLMCYGAGTTIVCPASHEPLFDCNHDDYFNTSPAPGSYLASNWNTASSSFLDTVATLPSTAVTIGGPSTTSVNHAVTLSAGLAPGVAASAYAWTVPGPDCAASGGTTGASVLVTCTTTGTFGISLDVNQSDGQMAHASGSLTVNAAPAAAPTIAINGPATAAAGDPVTFTSTVTSTLATTVGWSGLPAGCTAPGGLSGASMTFSCNVGADVTVTATVTQSDGQTAVASQLVSVSAPPAPPPPVVTPPLIDPLVAVPISRPVVKVSGPSRVRAGMPVVLTASSATVTSWSWSANRPCLVGRRTTTRMTVVCPTTLNGIVTITVTGKQPDGQSARVTHAISLTGTPRVLAASFTGPSVVYAGVRATLKGRLLSGSSPVRGIAVIQSSTDRRYWRSVARIDLGTTGRLSLAVAPARTTYYRMTILVAPHAGWSTPRALTLRLTVKPRVAARLALAAQTSVRVPVEGDLRSRS